MREQNTPGLEEGRTIICEDCGNTYPQSAERWSGIKVCEGCGGDGYWLPDEEGATLLAALKIVYADLDTVEAVIFRAKAEITRVCGSLRWADHKSHY